jgi:hypothetical protein
LSAALAAGRSGTSTGATLQIGPHESQALPDPGRGIGFKELAAGAAWRLVGATSLSQQAAIFFVSREFLPIRRP